MKKTLKTASASGQVRATTGSGVEEVELDTLKPATMNDKVYRPVEASDPAIRSLAERIAKQGVLEPLVVTLDNVIVSGHGGVWRASSRD